MKLSRAERINRIGMKAGEVDLAEQLREIVARGGPDVQRLRTPGKPLKQHWYEAAAAALRTDLVNRHLLVTHSSELSAGKEVHSVTAGEHTGNGPSALHATAQAWLAAGTALDWGSAGARELQLVREIESLEQQVMHFKGLAQELAMTISDIISRSTGISANEMHEARGILARTKEDLGH